MLEETGWPRTPFKCAVFLTLHGTRAAGAAQMFADAERQA
jgi:hypothetical protein